MAPPGSSRGSSAASSSWMCASFSAGVVGNTAKSRLLRLAPPSKQRSSMPTLAAKWPTMSAITSGLAVAVRHITGGTASSPAFSRMKRAT
ncbi:MAG: hypothetical protein AW07_03856 [Candidatus Accumulibacter sp. SK-11]|nr:MAG: hypothetical protein AW07_03856 [Candidatus Accumulibacter sp. SK-11]